MFRPFRWLMLFFGATPSFAAEPDNPKAKFKLGQDTTFVTEPLDKDGYIDYETALNERLRGKIKPEENAVVLLVQALGPKPEGKIPHADYFKWLGIDSLPEKGEYFVPESKYAEQLRDDELASFSQAAAQLRWETWKAKEYPKLAAWMKTNEKPLAIVIEASKKPAYYDPLIERDKAGGRELLAGTYGLTAVTLRPVGALLMLRAMNHLGEGRQAESWHDLQAFYQLSRQLSQSGSLVALLTSTQLESDAIRGILIWIETVKPTSAQAFEYRKSLSKLSTYGRVSDVIGYTERITFLDATQYLARGVGKKLEDIAGVDLKNVPREKVDAIAEGLDWEIVLRMGNKWYDRLEHAQQIDAMADRVKAFGDIETESWNRVKQLKDTSEIQKRLEAREFEKVTQLVIERIGLTQINVMTPAGWKVRTAADRVEQQNRNLHLAFALVAHQADTARYPAALADLAPKYIDKIPDDLFSGKPLFYKPTDTGYLLHSVGVNGQDDGGKTYDDDPPGDDLVVRMPSRRVK